MEIFYCHQNIVQLSKIQFFKFQIYVYFGKKNIFNHIPLEQNFSFSI
jgi:hypothetical protein